MSKDLKLLDCTLRDGGYINDWKWGYKKAREIINLLVKANVDIVEVGFLRNIERYDKGITVCNRIEELKELLPTDRKKTMFSAMAMRSNYDIHKLSDHENTCIDLIRITAHDYDIKEGMEFAKAVQDKGYKLSINPINIMGYSDSQILWILEEVNKIRPYQFSIVDTFGSMKVGDLHRIVSLADHNLDRSIRLGLHLHENMALSFSLAQNFVNKHLQRPTTIDASLMGMGRIPGNLPIELIADYLNEQLGTAYDIDYLMDAIQEYIEPIKEETPWGYTPTYFLSAKYNLHRNYAEHYLGKGDLTNRDINHLLAQIEPHKTTVFDAEYADELYDDYLCNNVDDSDDIERLKQHLDVEEILVLAPGTTLKTHSNEIKQYIERINPTIIALNFIPEDIEINYAFYSNRKRYEKDKEALPENIITTSNLPANVSSFTINYNRLSGAFSYGCNSLILLLNLLKKLGIYRAVLAGADGYSVKSETYYDSSLHSSIPHDHLFNEKIGIGLRSLDMEICFLTPSEYEKYYKLIR